MQKGKPSKPEWIRVRLPQGDTCEQVEELVNAQGLHTVCVEARCPNRAECWGRGTATFIIMGDVCTRNCRFCAVKSGDGVQPDEGEPGRLAETVHSMGLRHVVITSVTRDDLADGGASFFAETIRRIRTFSLSCTIEVLVPDFRGNPMALARVVEARPDVIAHNMETVPRLYKQIRPQAEYQRSLNLLAQVKSIMPEMLSKSGIMLGLGESLEEIRAVVKDLKQIGCDILTMGQYLSPSRKHFPVQRYWKPDEFQALKDEAYATGFRWVESGPLVRSSYRSDAAVAQCLGALVV